VVAAAIRQAFLQADAEGARQTWRHVADQAAAALAEARQVDGRQRA